ncbi:MAG: hypothetical protein ALECFALPRED_000295 [Alectoria fallacina]|uniref:O-methyltransferase domain-containing protein n=1 Tax=Alectoria fallacina TaxID=1903189 RepID=A0A8H3J9R2_9LECA|nr:MAG: hypothetical protein ALECFALPRED_000295 [Alectoria fallacina]
MTSPEQAAQVAAATEEVSITTNAFQQSGGKDESARGKALVAARKLITALENPAETIMQHAFAGPERLCVRVAIDLRIFYTLAQHGGQPVSAAELAAASGAQATFIVRIMRVLVAIGFCGEADVESYVPTPLTMAMTALPLEAAVKNTYDHAYQAFAKMPEYFRQNGYQSPTDSTNGPLQFALNTKLSFFDYMGQYPQVSKEFDTFMTASRNMKPHWVDWYPVQDQILDGYAGGSEGENVLLVDVGGGYGQDLEYFKLKYPSAGRLVLQDLPRTIAEVKLSADIEAMSYDFFTRQPIKDARAYFFHLILHDWPDSKVREFLSNTASAMRPGYSKLILNEFILPDKGCDLFPALADIHMMGDLSGTERSEKQFRELLGSIGLEVVNFWQPPGASEGIIEAVKKSSGTQSVQLSKTLLSKISKIEKDGDAIGVNNSEVPNGRASDVRRHPETYTHIFQPALGPSSPPWTAITANDSSRTFWWSTTRCHMSSLLQHADYSIAAQHHALSFYHDCIVPCLGPQPSPRGSSDHFQSYCLDDYSPIEYSWCWNGRTGTDGAAKPKIRFAFEAIGPQAGSHEDPWNQDMSAHLVRTLEKRFEGQIDWKLFEYFWDALLPERKDTRLKIQTHAPKHTHQSSLFMACEMPGEEEVVPWRGMVVKAYFMPMLRALQENTSRTEVLDGAIRGLKGLLGNVQFPALSAVIEYMNAPDSPDFEVEMLAVDCVEPSRSRIKIYLRSQRTAWDVVSSVLTLRGRAPLSKAGLENLRRLWRLVLNLEGLSDAQDLPPVTHSTGGAFFCFYAQASQALPSAKLYIPVKHYAKDDAAGATGLVTFLQMQGEASYSKSFWKVLESIATHRSLDEGKGVQTYLSAQTRSDGGLSLTSYLGPEIYHSARWRKQ